MAAGQGFKTFVTGEVLTAGDVNGYLMQGINVFTNATARDAAITAPAEGQFAFTKDNNSLWYYDGAAWVASGATGDIEGVTAGVGISGGGTSGTVTITNSMATAIDAKGDLVAGTGADAFSRIAVGTNGQVLKANSATATGLEWGSASTTKNWTLLNAGGTVLSGTSTQITGLSSYDDLLVIIEGASFTTASAILAFTFNNVTSANSYTRYGVRIAAATSYSANNFFNYNLSTGTSIATVAMSNNASSIVAGGMLVSGCKGSGVKQYTVAFGATPAGGVDHEETTYMGVANATTAISTLEIKSTAGATFDAGSVYVYGA